MKAIEYMTVDGREVPIGDERNLLELIRKAGVDIPTFCYHSELSIYGACRLCIVEIEGMGVVTSCSVTPAPGMVVRTNTLDLRQTRRMTLELLLADHDQNCATCPKAGGCQLQALAQRFGVREVRFKPTRQPIPRDDSAAALTRDPNKCILCGDCVRMCTEVQGIGALDFVGRGADATVGPAFGKPLAEVECVSCGQCARVCPTGAIVPRSHVNEVWAALHDPEKTVVVQVAPAVRVALGECFGEAAGQDVMGKAVAALRLLGFDRVYDTSFAADLTVIEEAEEFLGRVAQGEKMPQFTSCCPAWVDLAEREFADLLPNVSSCRSPQQMFGALAKEYLPQDLGVDRKQLVVVSVMPCTAKKREASLERFSHGGLRDVDVVLTTQELAQMIQEAGLDFGSLDQGSLDMPFGFKTGAGVIFGASGGVSEAVLRYASERLTGVKPATVEFQSARGSEGVREAAVEVAGKTLRLGIVHGLANARRVVQQVREGVCAFDFIEVMACPGGCVGGAGQPVCKGAAATRQRAKGLYATDRQLHFHTPQDNPFVRELYAERLGTAGSDEAHRLLHTHYQMRRRLHTPDIPLHTGEHFDKVPVTVCVGTSCHLRGSQKILSGLASFAAEEAIQEHLDLQASFCTERCDRGPVVRVGDRVLEGCTLEEARQAVREEIGAIKACYDVGADQLEYPTVADFERQTMEGLRRFIALQNPQRGETRCEHATCGHGTGAAGCLHQ